MATKHSISHLPIGQASYGVSASAVVAFARKEMAQKAATERGISIRP